VHAITPRSGDGTEQGIADVTQVVAERMHAVTSVWSSNAARSSALVSR